jgi:arylsulfatase A-like enzyme
VLLLLAGCGAAPALVEPPLSCADITPGQPAPTTVLLLSVDTLHHDFVRPDLTPRIHALLDEGVRFDHLIVPRGLSGPSMASFITGAYPRTHGVRVNGISVADEGVSPDVPTLARRFADAGHRSYGFLSNQCYLLDDDMETRCTWADPTLDQAEGDAVLVPELLAALGALPADEPVFAWLHLLDPHDPYETREPWFSVLHPGTYDGPYLDTEAAIAAHMREGAPYTDADRAWVEAVYASQVAATDALIGDALDGLAALGRLDDAVVVFVADHGEELGRRTSYFYHGCSPYDGVIDVRAGIWAPGRLPGGHVVTSRVSSVHLAPTVAELAGLPWDGPAEGRSLVSALATCEQPEGPAFFERGNETAGVVSGRWKYILDPNAGFAECKYYDAEAPYPGEPEALYDLEADPLEQVNRVADQPELARALRANVCGWVRDDAWVGGSGEGNRLLAECP